MTGEEIIDFAAQLAENRTAGEVSYRSAASRAYYGAFHIACSLLRDLGFPVPKSGQGHDYVYKRLLSCGHPGAVDAARKLGNLRTERNIADYDLAHGKFKKQKNARLCAARAREAARSLDACRSEPARATVHSGIIAFEERLRRPGS